MTCFILLYASIHYGIKFKLVYSTFTLKKVMKSNKMESITASTVKSEIETSVIYSTFTKSDEVNEFIYQIIIKLTNLVIKF